MIWQHLRTYLWLKSRLRANKNRRAGSVSVILQSIFTALAILVALGSLASGMAVGGLAFDATSAPLGLMVVWDVAVLAFLFFWMIELMAELQRSELLSLEKFLHLPVSVTGAFLINYVGSLFSFGAMVVLPAMVGLACGLTYSMGPIMVLLFPLIAAFITAITAVTYQFRGWLAAIMSNPRRRRTILAFAGLGFMLIFQLPNIFLHLVPTERFRAAGEEETDRLERVGILVNASMPFGWLPYGAMSLAEGRAAPALLGTLGLGLIAAVSLKRSYGTTVRLYRGEYTSTKRAPRPAATRAPAAGGLLEKQLPWVSEHASAIAMASLRSTLRAPEAKMILLSPVIMAVVFGSLFLHRTEATPLLLRPLMVIGGFAFTLLMLIGIAGNLFGFDRGAFRVYVLASAPRKDILLGKNLSFVPFAAILMLVVLAALEITQPLRLDHLLAVALQAIPMYLIYCAIGNLLSMYAPMVMAPGSFRPAKPKAMTLLIHAGFTLLLPMALAPTLIPLGLEYLLSWWGRFEWFPAYLVFTLAEVAIVLLLYPAILEWQGSLLQSREQKILEIVTAKVE